MPVDPALPDDPDHNSRNNGVFPTDRGHTYPGVDENCRGAAYAFSQSATTGTLSLELPVGGTGMIDFGNCWSDENGLVVLAINGVTIEKVEGGTNSVVDFHAGDVLTLQDQGHNSIIRLNSIE